MLARLLAVRGRPRCARIFERTAALAICLCLMSTAPARADRAAAFETRSLRAELDKNKALPAAPRLAAADLLRRTRLREVKLSPDGAWVAYLEADGQSANLSLLNVKTRAKRRLLGGIGRQELHWAAGGEAIFMVSPEAVSVVSLKDGIAARIAVLDKKRNQAFLGVDASRPEHALISEFDRVRPLYRVLRIGREGAPEVLYEGARELRHVLLDGDGKLTFIKELGPEYEQIVSRRNGGRWQEVARCKRLRACQLVALSEDRRSLAMMVNHEDDRRALVELDLEKGTQRLVHTDRNGLSDLRTVVLSPRSRRPLFAVFGMPVRRNDGLTPDAKRAAEDIGKKFADSSVTVDPAENARYWLMTERGARLSQERFWLYDRVRRVFEEILAAERAAGKPIPERALARKIPIHYRASDGFLVHGYLSLPPGKDAASLPLITAVHGGPWGRVESDYSAHVQLLVNRGNAVFQPNFRASTGYGDQYMLAARGDFGYGRVHKDILDGVEWLLKQGVGDRTRMAVIGDSFGGYSTLLALSHTPELFRFGMAGVPPSDFVRSLRDAVASMDADGNDGVPYKVRFADLELDLNDAERMQRLAAAAPINHTDKLIRPVVLLAGGKDEKVSIASVTEYVAKLQGRGKPVSLLVDPDEGHNPRKPIVAQAYLHLLEKLLHRYLDGPEPAAPAPELARYLERNLKVDAAFGATLGRAPSIPSSGRRRTPAPRSRRANRRSIPSPASPPAVPTNAPGYANR